MRAQLTLIATTIIGCLLIEYGIRIAIGCHIGRFVSGVASTSLHNWLWIVAALGEILLVFAAVRGPVCRIPDLESLC